MFRPWPTTHYVTLATLGLTIACSTAATEDTDAASSTGGTGTAAEQTTQSSITGTIPTTGDTASTDGPVTTGGTTSNTTATTGPDSSTSTDGSASTGTTSTGETADTTTATTGTTTDGTGTSSSGSSSTGNPETCEDIVLNQDETDVDCGGSCPVCDDGKDCLVDADCSSNECTGNICTMVSCVDKAKNGAETDIDCGGKACPACIDGLACAVDIDCLSQSCIENLCKAPSCDDKAKNGAETDIDCGGPKCGPCADGGACLMNVDCASGVCTVDTCTGSSCFDGLKNGAETLVDCGGPACAPCQLMTLVINEVDYDQTGTDAAEFIEIFNNTGAPVNLTGLEVRLINGAMADLKVYATIKLGNGMLAQGQYLVIAPVGFIVPPEAVFVPFAGLTNQMQNGDPDGLALVDVPNKIVLDVLSYGGAITNAVLGAPFPVTSLVEGMALPAKTKDNSDPSRSLARTPNGNDKNDAATDWTSTVIVTPGLANK